MPTTAQFQVKSRFNEPNIQEPKVISLSSEKILLLRRKLEAMNEVTPFEHDVELFSQIASYGIFREIGTVNDELARFIFDVTTGQPIRVASLRAQMIEWNGLFGLRVFSIDSQRLELRTSGFYDVVHPYLSGNKDGSLHSLVIFPEIVRKIAKAEGVELVVVKSWAKNSVFGGFDPKNGYYQTNFWELENNDTLKFADLLRNGRIPLLGTHDLVAHVPGINRHHWTQLRQNAERVYQSVADYLQLEGHGTVVKMGTQPNHESESGPAQPSLAALILPYTIGVVLDDLAQPPSYASKSHLAVLEVLLRRLAKKEISANGKQVLLRFPESFQQIIELSRTSNIENSPEEIERVVGEMMAEILRASLSK